jgi:TctA family transporter
MENTFTYSIIISLIYIIIKFIETKTLLKNNDKTIKHLVKDTIIVYLSSVLGLYVVQQLNPGTIATIEPGAFTTKPEF